MDRSPKLIGRSPMRTGGALSYASAVAAVAVAVVCRFALQPLLGDGTPFLTFYPAIALTSYYWDLGASLLSVVLSALAALYFFTLPHMSFALATVSDAVALVIFALVSLVIVGVSEALRRGAARQAHLAAQWYATLASVGDAVIVCDAQGSVTFLNKVAEELTGFSPDAAEGQPLERVFAILDEQTRQPRESPHVRALRERMVVGLANHTVLVGRDGRERVIEDSAAPIVEPDGTLSGVVLVFRDATARRESEVSLQRARERLQRQYNAVPLPAYTYERREDGEFVLVDMNASAQTLAAPRSADHMLGRTARELDPDRPDLLGFLERCYREQGSFAEEIQYQMPGERTPRTLVTQYAFAPPNLVMVHVDDVTNRRAAERAQQQLAAIVESSDDAIVGKDLTGRVTSWNRSAERLFGYTADEMIGQSIRRIIPPEGQAEEDSVLARVRKGEAVEHFDTVRQRKDGSSVDVSITVSPILNAAGQIVGASKVARDITQRRRDERHTAELLARERQAQAGLVAARNRLAFLSEVGAVLASSLDYQETLGRAVRLALPRLGDYCNVLTVDDTGVLRHAASAHSDPDREALLREAAGRLLPAPDRDVSPASRVLSAERTVVMTVAEMQTYMAGLAIADPDAFAPLNRLDPGGYVGVPLRVRGRIAGVISFSRSAASIPAEYDEGDVSLVEEFARRVSLAIENARLFRRAEELNRLKDEFLATLSHELRTPLSAIIGWSRMLRTGQLREDARDRAYESIERNAQAQARLVEDILDVARGASGSLRLDPAPISLGEVARRAVATAEPAAAARQITLALHAPEPAPTVMGDAARLQQVAWNLLANAVKFTPVGGRVTTSVVQEGADAVLTVADTGVGIPPEFLPYVFDKFRQADASFTRSFGGLGLGLAIVRQLTELHGGRVEAHSDGEGRGATFIVRLPVIPDAPAALDAAGRTGSTADMP